MIRKATIADIETISEFNAHLAKETEGIELNRERLKKGITAIISDPAKGVYFLYEKNNLVVGQIMITSEWSDWRNAYFWWIQSVYVQKSYRRQGVFQDLFNQVKEIVAQDSSICGLRLYVEQENKIAQLTYKNLGMDQTYYLMYEWEK